MASYQDVLPSFQDVIEKGENMAFMTRASVLQKQVIEDLDELAGALLEYKTEAIASSEEDNANAFLYKSLLSKLYGKEGLFYFCKFIIGDLQELGYPTGFRYNARSEEHTSELQSR